MNTVIEFIWHFAGYLHISQDIALARIEYEDSARLLKSNDYSVTLTFGQRAIPDAEDFSATVYRVDAPDVRPGGSVTPLKLHVDRPAEHTKLPVVEPLKPLPPIDPPPFGGGGGGASIDSRPAPATYIHGGDDKLMQLFQHNILVDNNGLLDQDGNWTPQNVLPILNDILDKVDAQVPQGLQLSATDTHSILSFVDERDANRAEAGPDPNDVNAGHYINGVLSNDPQSPFTLPPTNPTPIPDGTAKDATATIHNDWPVGQSADLGSNTLVNAATIADINEVSTGLVVLGNYYSLKAMIQVNYYQNNDSVTLHNAGGDAAGLDWSALVNTNPDSAVNDAAFVIKEIASNAGVPHQHADLHWNITIADGNYYDVKAITQANVLINNDLTVQTSSQTYSMVTTGGDQQQNVAQWWDMSQNYDLIIVQGNYHDYAMIFQKNILINNDSIYMFSDNGDGALFGSQSVESGGNSLLNHAYIEQIGGHDFQSLRGDVSAFITAMQHQEPTLSSVIGSEFKTSGTINVLYVTGDYYNVNIVSQLNVLSDNNQAIQVMAGHSISTNDVGQTVSTGNDQLINFAGIFQGGNLSSFQYLAGHAYQDSVLVQANLVENNSSVIHNDTTTLVPEVVAFIGDHSADPAFQLLLPPQQQHVPADGLSGVMHA